MEQTYTHTYYKTKYLEERDKDVRGGAGGEDKCEEGAEPAVEDRRPDVGQGPAHPLVSAACKMKYSVFMI